MNSNTDTRQSVNKTIDKLAKICGMLGSDHPGERASAALLATQILDYLELSWSDIVFAAFQSYRHEHQNKKAIEYDDRPPGWHVKLCNDILNTKGDEIDKWGVNFLSSLLKRYRSIRLTKKQADCLDNIAKLYGFGEKK